MSERRLKAFREAIAALRQAEREAVETLSRDNNAENRKNFEEIHSTLKTLRSALREEESKFIRLLKRLSILPG
ncbi:MAG TPA: hypothetical protein VHC00_21105 [Rhizobiaceae bacterium]|nr:hypothetical protein [Rhizobiaceae bacterium]